ncbi:DUF6526 family protein [Paenibacillus peoriae]
MHTGRKPASFVLTGNLPDPHFTMNPIIALRFTSNSEFLPLCERLRTMV